MKRTFCPWGCINDIIQNAFGYAFTGGLGAHHGPRLWGPPSFHLLRQHRSADHFLEIGSRLCATPSYFVHIIETAEDMGSTAPLPLRVGVFGAEP